MQKKALGRGLEALIPALGANKGPAGEAIIVIPLSKIKPNRFQPRKKFDKEKLQELADSINKHGLAQPILVSPSIAPGEYEIIAGERRFRASKLAGKKDIRAIVKQSTNDKQRFDLALIENLQRADLDPVEEAFAYKRLIEEFKHTHEEIAAVVGKSRSVVSNTMRILNLPQNVQDLISEGKISSGHGRMLAGLEDEAQILALVDQILNEKLSVRGVEQKVADLKPGKKKKEPKKQELEVLHLQEELQRKFQTKVQISGNSNKGKIEIKYFSLEDLERIAKELKIAL